MQDGVSVNGRASACFCECVRERSCDHEPLLCECVSDHRPGLRLTWDAEPGGMCARLCVFSRAFAAWKGDGEPGCVGLWAYVRRVIVCNSLRARARVCVCVCVCVCV